jgi:DNA-binding PadR family transcriptional regulator
VNSQYRELGQAFRLSQAALELGIFTVSELMSLTGVGENTIYSFLSRLGEQSLQSKDLPSTGRGRPKKRYGLTEAGVAMLAAQNSNILAAVGKIRTESTNRAEQLRREIMKLPAHERVALINQLRQNLEEPAAPVSAAQYESA